MFMKLKSLELHNYRRFATLKIGFHDQLTVLIGTNGAGKTMVLQDRVLSPEIPILRRFL